MLTVIPIAIMVIVILIIIALLLYAIYALILLMGDFVIPFFFLGFIILLALYAYKKSRGGFYA